MKLINRRTRSAMQFEFVRKLSPNTRTAIEPLAIPSLGVPEQQCIVLYLFENRIAASPVGSVLLYITNADSMRAALAPLAISA